MSDSRVQQSTKNFVYAAVLQFVKIVLVFASRIVFVKILGASYLGINGLFSNVLGILSLADLGMATAMMYSLYKPLAKKDYKLINAYMNFYKKVYNYIAIIVTVFGILMIPFLKYMINLPENIPHIYLYYIILLSNTVVSYLYISVTTLAVADQKSYLINGYDIIFQLVVNVLQVIILILTKSFALYLLVNTFCILLGNIFKVKAVKKEYKYLSSSTENKLPKKARKELYNNVKSLFLYKIGSIIQGSTDNILISIMVGTVVVGYYSNYCTIILAITTFITMFFTSLKASLGNYIVENNTDNQYNMFCILEFFNYWLVTFCSICFYTLIPDFIKICFGKEYLLSDMLLFFAVLNFYTTNIRQTIWAFRETTGIFQKTKYITLVTSILNIFLSIVLGKIMGLEGIILATIVSRLLYAWWKEPKILYNDYFKVSVWKYIKQYLLRVLEMLIVMICCSTVCNLISIENIYVLFLMKMIITSLITVLLFILIYHKTNAFQYAKKIVLNVLKRRKYE